MKEPIVADSAALIGLERINRLEILPKLFEPVLIPTEIAHEFGVSLPWLKIEPVRDQTLISALKLIVDDGEAEAIALACERNCKVLLDDKQARSVAKNLGVKTIGIVGALLLAKQSGILPLLKPVLIELKSTGFYLSDALVSEALRLSDELGE